MDPRLAAHLELTEVADAEFVARAYRLLLRRDPEPEAFARDVAKLREGTLSRSTLLRELFETEEFARVQALDDAIAFASWARSANERPRELRAPPGDERPIEIPWCLSRYRGEPRLLDVGYAFAEPAYLAALAALGARDLVGVDLAEAEVPGLRPVRGDVRDLPFRRRAFDAVLCISTLEHVGRDVRRYGAPAEDDPDALTAALRELRRVTAGRLLVTVPCGRPEERDWFVQLEPEDWLETFGAAGFVVFEHETYALDDDGWRAAPGSGAAYRDTHAGAVLCAELHPATAGVRLRQLARRVRGRESPGARSGPPAPPEPTGDRP